jgi:hypothetical protein
MASRREEGAAEISEAASDFHLSASSVPGVTSLVFSSMKATTGREVSERSIETVRRRRRQTWREADANAQGERQRRPMEM